MSDIAIIGVGCRLPGADNKDDFWRVLKNGENHVIEVPSDRWNLEAFYDADPDTPGKTHVRRAGFINEHDKWDFKVYGVNELEAQKMDPQHKYVLDSVHMALENAGLTKQQVNLSNTGVYIGMMNSDYSRVFTEAEESDNYTLTGISNSIVAARVSYVYNLLGPCLTVDTACSSSLVAVHLACQALRAGECDMAIAGGVNSLLTPDIFIQLSRAGMMSPTGQCQAFSENADGYARGEGCGIIILKPVDQALKDNDPIWATIVTAVNHDGQTVSPITTPSGQQQQALLATVCDRYHINKDTVDYIEAHGTGTKAGDPVEVRALGNFFHSDSNTSQKYIGSVKTNIGHLESAAGVAGLIKTLLMHKHGEIVPSLHFLKPHENVPLDKFNLKVPTQVYPWPSEDIEKTYYRSAVNSFSFGGTNCNAIVTTNKNNQQKQQLSEDTPGSTQPRVVSVSACDMVSLTKMVSKLCEELPEYDLTDVSYTSLLRRNHLQFRTTAVGTTITDIIHSLQKFEEVSQQITQRLKKKKKIIFVFAGMGTNWKGMCRQLLDSFPSFHSTITLISNLLKKYLSWDLVDKLHGGCGYDDSMIGPLMTFACEVGLFHLLKEFGVAADAIVGQSIGEVAAAHAAGVLSLEHAVDVIYHRTIFLAEATGGKMFVVRQMNVSLMSNVMEGFKDRANIALFYSPVSCAISCDDDMVELLKKTLQQAEHNVLFIDLPVTTAFHSHHTAVSSEKLKTSLKIQGTAPTIPIFSTVTGREASRTDFMDSVYWANNVRAPVLFSQAISAAHDPEACNIFVELGPKPVLRGHLDNIFQDSNMAFAIPTILRDNELVSISKCVAALFEHGLNINWKQFVNFKGKVVDVPQYQFNRITNLYIPSSVKEALMGINTNTCHHPFVRPLKSKPTSFKVFLETKRVASIYEHKVNNIITIPGAFYAEVGLAIASHMSASLTANEVTIEFKRPLILMGRDDRELDVALNTEESESGQGFRICNSQTIYATGTITPYNSATCEQQLNLDDIRSRCTQSKSSQELYSDLSTLFNFTYGHAMKILRHAFVNKEEEALVEFHLNDLLKSEMKGTILHPAVIDALLQSGGALFSTNKTKLDFFPIQLTQLRVFGHVEDSMYCYIKRIQGTGNLSFLIHLCKSNGQIIATITKYTIKIISKDTEKRTGRFYVQRCTQMETLPPILSGRTNQINNFMTISCTSREGCNDNTPCLVISENAEERKTQLEENETRIHGSKNIVIRVKASSTELYDGHDIQKAVLEKLLWLRDILTYLHQHTEDCRVAVVTDSTWSLTKDASNNFIITNCEPVQASIWGFLRSVQKENMSFKLYLVDIRDDQQLSDGNEPRGPNDSQSAYLHHGSRSELSHKEKQPHIDLLSTNNITRMYMDSYRIQDVLVHIMNALSNSLKDRGELVVHREVICGFQCLFFETNQDKPFIQKAESEYRDFEMFSTNQAKVEKPFQMYPKYNQSTTRKNVVSLNVKSLVFQNPTLFTTCQGALHRDGDVAGFPVVCLETIGTIESGKGSDNTRPLHVSCYPVHAASRIEVPSLCCLPMATFPQYQPGQMTLYATLWSLCRRVKLGGAIAVMSSNKTSFHGELLYSMLSFQKVKNIVRVNPEQPLEYRSSEVREMINVCELDRTMVSHMIQSYPKLTRFITLSALIRQDCEPLLRQQFPRTDHIIVSGWDLFSHSNLCESLPVMAKWLRKSYPVIDAILNTNRLYWKESDCLSKLCSVKEENVTNKKENVPRRRFIEGRMFSKSAVYIVVGGLTGLGWVCVEYLATNNAGTVVCFNRREPSSDDMKKMKQLSTKTLSEVCVLKVDVTDFISVKQGMGNIMVKFQTQPVKGVVFGAGVLQDVAMVHLTESQLWEVLNPKISGAWNMHLVTDHMELDFFIMHSSITSVFGAHGQSNYGAANAFQDSLALRRRRLGLPGQSINWGPLNMGMLEANEANKRTRIRMEHSGYLLISKEEVGTCLQYAILSDLPEIIIADLDLKALKNHFRGDSFAISKFSKVLPKSTYTISESAGGNPSTYQVDLNTLKTVRGEQRMFILESYISKLVGKLFIIDENLLSPKMVLVDEGLDSMSAMTIVSHVKNDLGYKIPVNLLFSPETTIYSLSQFINENLGEHGGDEQSDLNTEYVDDPEVVSYMEYRYFKLYEHPVAFKSLHVLVDVYFSDRSLTFKQIYEIVLQVTSKNPILRTAYTCPGNTHASKLDIKRKLLPTKDAIDLVLIDQPDPSQVEGDFELKRMEKFDVSAKGPVRFIYYSKGNTMRIGISCNHISFDIASMRIFLPEFFHCLKNLIFDHTPIQTPHRDLSMAANVMDRQLTQDFEKLKTFWKRKIVPEVPEVSIDPTKEYLLGDGQSFISQTLLSTELHKALQDLSKILHTTVVKIIISAYQLFLSHRSGLKRICLTLQEDVRSSLPVSQNTMGCLINHIPVLANIPDDSTTVHDFLVNNSRQINDILDHSLFPYDEIVKLVPEGENSDLYRQVITVNDNTFMDELMKLDEANPPKLLETNNQFVFSESCIFVLFDQKADTTSLKLQLCKEMYSLTETNQILTDVIDLLHQMTFNHNLTLKELRYSGHFIPETTTGRLKIVTLTFLPCTTDEVMIVIGDEQLKKNDVRELYFLYRKKSDKHTLVITTTTKKDYCLHIPEGKYHQWKSDLAQFYQHIQITTLTDNQM